MKAIEDDLGMAAVFSSVARGKETPGSDIDRLVRKTPL
jgi:predicted nucleotidyltransferase